MVDGWTLNNLATQKFKNRHSIHDWYRSILQEEAFTRITKVTDLKPGDVATRWQSSTMRNCCATGGWFGGALAKAPPCRLYFCTTGLRS